MWEFEKNIVRKAFKNYWGLQDALKTALESKDNLLLDGAIDSLKTYSGMREQFLKDNLEEIVNL